MSRNRFVLDFQEIDRSQIALVGGKGAHLGALARIDGVHVPPGLCVTTVAFQRIIVDAPSLTARLDRLSRLPDLITALVADGARITKVEPHVPTLEDLYFTIRRQAGSRSAGPSDLEPIPAQSGRAALTPPFEVRT